jgi:uncharacterized protein YktA (UPF0223 family)
MVDVKQEVAPTSADSSAAEGEAGKTNASTSQPNPSAETLNTVGEEKELPKSIPYDRFKEVNDRLRAIEKEYEEYVKNKELYEVYKQFDSILEQNPQLLESIKNAILEAQQQQPTMQQFQQPYANPMLAQNLALAMYINEFQKLAKEDNIPSELNEEYQEFVRQELIKRNPDPLNNFNLQLFHEAYKAAKERMNKIIKLDRSLYLNEKKQDQAPPSPTKGGMQPIQDTNFKDSYERAQYIASVLKATT